MITGEQIKAARLRLGWSVERLAKEAGIGVAVVALAESAAGEPPVTRFQRGSIQHALERAGVEFPEIGSGAGAQLREDRVS